MLENIEEQLTVGLHNMLYLDISYREGINKLYFKVKHPMVNQNYRGTHFITIAKNSLSVDYIFECIKNFFITKLREDFNQELDININGVIGKLK